MYQDFSSIYDLLMSDVDYNAWKIYFKSIFDKFSKKPNLILDLGCGTGTLTNMLANDGFDMIGVDSSTDMLAIAKEKNQNILYLNMDITDFELYGTVDAIISSLDCINYVCDENDLVKLLRLVNNYLNFGGLFIFDISSEYKLSNVLGDNTFVFDEKGVFYSWENYFEDNICTLNLTFFVENEDGLYKRINETQYQRAYSVNEILNAAKIAGLNVLGVYDEFTFNTPKDKSERIFFVLEKPKEESRL